MIIVIKYDLKIIQINAVNVFVNCDVNEIVYTKKASYFERIYENSRISKFKLIHKNNLFLNEKFFHVCIDVKKKWYFYQRIDGHFLKKKKSFLNSRRAFFEKNQLHQNNYL